MPYKARDCVICTRKFTPPHRATNLSTGENHMTHCPQCRRQVKAAINKEETFESPHLHQSAAPMTQVVFDLETWGLDRGWGVTMVGSFLIFNGSSVVAKTLTLRDYEPWKQGRRSDDSALVRDMFTLLKGCHIAYAHNGEFFDIRWLRTVALKYKLEMPSLKLIDPAQLARQKYRFSSNSLESIADYLELPHTKYHLAKEVWRRALLDDSRVDWEELRVRCESDVLLLNAVAGAVTGDVGMIDFKGSGFGRK